MMVVEEGNSPVDMEVEDQAHTHNDYVDPDSLLAVRPHGLEEEHYNSVDRMPDHDEDHQHVVGAAKAFAYVVEWGNFSRLCCQLQKRDERGSSFGSLSRFLYPSFPIEGLEMDWANDSASHHRSYNTRPNDELSLHTRRSWSS